MRIAVRVFGSLFLLMFLAACTGNVMDSYIQQAKMLLALNNGQISLVSNSTAQEAQCASTNTVVLQLSLPAGANFYCLDASTLMTGAQQGPVCPGGVTINPITPPTGAVNCHNLTLCGVLPSSTSAATQKSDGSYSQTLTFTNVPWGCQAEIKYSTDPSLVQNLKTMSTQIIPPLCPYCTTTGSPTCLSCAALGTNQQVISNQVITNCTGASCQSCQVTTSAGPVTVPHGKGYTFFTAPRNSCPQHCNQISQLRICNNGFFMGDPSYSFAQCTDAGCGCTLAGSAITYNSGQTYSLYSSNAPKCPNSCSTVLKSVQCQDGQWEDTSGAALTSAQLSAFPYSQCKEPTCTCPAGALNIPNGSSATVFSANVVSCTDSCLAHMGTVTCQNMVLSGNTSYAYASCGKDPSCNTSSPSPSPSPTNSPQPAPAQAGSCTNAGATVTNGQSAYFYMSNAPPAPQTCAMNSAVFTCSNGTFQGPANITSYPYISCQSKTDAGTLGGTGGGTGNSNGPGSAIKQVYGLADSDATDSVGCLDATTCQLNAINSVPTTHPQTPCVLPWGGGEIEMYATVMAFNATCVVTPDLCSKHRQSRTCHFPTWTGSTAYKYSSCVEKASCP